MHEAKSNLSKLVRRAAAGEEITIANHGGPSPCSRACRQSSRNFRGENSKVRLRSLRISTPLWTCSRATFERTPAPRHQRCYSDPRGRQEDTVSRIACVKQARDPTAGKCCERVGDGP